MAKQDSTRRDRSFTLVGKLTKIPAIVTTDSGKQESVLRGEIAFKVELMEGGVRLWLTRLSLIGDPVKCEKGSSGLLSVSLGPKPREVEYSRDGRFGVKAALTVHYPLIDQIHGYVEPREEQPDFFASYVDTSRCELEGRFERPLDELVEVAMAAEDSDEEIQIGEVLLQARVLTTEFRYVEQFAFEVSVASFFLVFVLENWIDIQPVFVRSNANDPSPTGSSFDILIQSAKCIWRKCCIHFSVRDPMYVNDADYKVLNSQQEAFDLKDEVSVADAVEVFVAKEFDPIIWGGGASISSGTANAKIVTCDDQLCVEAADGSSLGAINVNHLAHELGHVLGLDHPGGGNPGLVAGTANSVMEPSGFYADNPHAQSQHNCDSVSNPLVYYRFASRRCRCVQNPEL